MSFSMTRPVVVLPQPLSPTRPSVSPAYRSSEMRSTALISPTLWVKTVPRVTGKYFDNSLTCRSGWLVMTPALHWCRPAGCHCLHRASSLPDGLGQSPGAVGHALSTSAWPAYNADEN